MRSVVGSIMLLSAASLAAAQAQPPATSESALEPINRWVVHYDDSECYAERTYGPVTDPTTFGIRPATMGGTYELFLAKRGSASKFAEQIKISIDLGQSEVKPYALRYASDDRTLAIDKFRVKGSTIESLPNDANITVRIGSKRPISLTLHDVNGLVATLHHCVSSLRRYWNMDPDQQSKIATPSKGDMRRLFSSSDYPQEALVNGQGGMGQFLLFIDEAGKVAACETVVPSGIPSLDGMSCQVIRARAKGIQPARDKAGKPMRSTVVTPPIKWQMGY